MFRFAVLCLAIAAVTAYPTLPNQRVVGGQQAERNQFPYQISLQWDLLGIKQHVCGGSILNENWVLTAGHCITEVPSFGTFFVRAGILSLDDTNMQQIEVVEKIVHPDYAGGVNPNDIALLRLKTPLSFNEAVKAVDLPSANDIPAGDSSLSGWGSVSSTQIPSMPKVLQWAELPIIPFDECAEAVKLINGGVVEPLAETNVCTGPLTGGQSACSGDSGGPLAQGNTLIGIVSWGWIPCGSAGAPSVYTMVSQFIGWIETTAV